MKARHHTLVALCAVLFSLQAAAQPKQEHLEFFMVKPNDTVRIVDQIIPATFDGVLMARLVVEDPNRELYEQDMFIHLIHARNHAPVFRHTVKGLSRLQDITLNQASALVKGDHIFLECRVHQNDPVIYKFYIQ